MTSLCYWPGVLHKHHWQWQGSLTDLAFKNFQVYFPVKCKDTSCSVRQPRSSCYILMFTCVYFKCVQKVKSIFLQSTNFPGLWEPFNQEPPCAATRNQLSTVKLEPGHQTPPSPSINLINTLPCSKSDPAALFFKVRPCPPHSHCNKQRTVSSR